MDYRSDTYYISKVLEGKINAFSYLVDRHKDKAFNLALRICGNREEAEEIAQDAFIKAFRSLKDFKKKSRFSTWMYRIVYNTAVTIVRGRKQGILSLEEFPADAIDFLGFNSTEEDAVEDYRNSLISFALLKISEEERGLITLYYYNELGIEEISEITGISRSNIKVKLFRARKKMIEIIRKAENKKILYNESERSI